MDKDLAQLRRTAHANPADVGAARSLEATLARLGQSQLLLERYRFKFICSLSFDALEQTSDPAVRHCADCKRNVHAIVDPTELRAAANAGHCVSVPASVVDEALEQLVNDPAAHSAEAPESLCLVQNTASPIDEQRLDWEPKCLLLTPGEPLNHNPSAWERVSFLCAAANVVVLDVSKSPALNSLSMGHLVKLGDRLASRGGFFVLLAPLSPGANPPQGHIRLVIEMLGLNAFFSVAATLEEARDLVRPRPRQLQPRLQPQPPALLGRIAPPGR
jgi:anti-anti-sigma regulatory factor